MLKNMHGLILLFFVIIGPLFCLFVCVVITIICLELMFAHTIDMIFEPLICFIASIPFLYSSTILTIDEGALASTTDTRYLSYNIDAQVLPKFGNATLFHNKRFVTLLSALTPCWVRLGGTDGDRNVLQTNANIPPPQNPYTFQAFKNFCLLSSMFNINFTFGLNLLLRDVNAWDPSNAEELMKSIKQLNQEGEECRVHFELGNEPDLFFSQGYPVNESQLADDFGVARKLIDQMQFRRRTLLFGPDVASPLLAGYFEQFLKSLPPDGVLDGLTYHHFYDRVKIANPDYSYNPQVLDKFLDRASYALLQKEKYHQSAALILGETADYTDGGAEGISNTYLTGFMFLDSLGIAAVLKHSIYFKQSLFGTPFSSLLDVKTDFSSVDPNPAYWVALLYRRLVGQRVLSVTGTTDKNRSVRMYAHCLNRTTNGSVVVYLMNLGLYPEEIQLSNTDLVTSTQHWYLLSSDKPDLNGLEMFVNGKKLVLSGDGSLPDIVPDVRQSAKSFQFPPRRYGFIVFPSARIKPCITAINY